MFFFIEKLNNMEPNFWWENTTAFYTNTAKDVYMIFLV